MSILPISTAQYVYTSLASDDDLIDSAFKVLIKSKVSGQSYKNSLRFLGALFVRQSSHPKATRSHKQICDSVSSASMRP
jgi:hypothetical protein